MKAPYERFTFAYISWRDPIYLKLGEPDPRVTLVRCLTVAKLNSMGLGLP